MLCHAVWRSVVLILLGVFLRSVGRKQTNWTFEDTLSQIGLGYVFLFLLAYARRDKKPGWHFLTVGLILLVYWLSFAAYPNLFGYPFVNLSGSRMTGLGNWPHQPTGFAAHWAKHANPAEQFDGWFLNLFPREKPFVFNAGGYATMSFVPTLATMILGLIAGSWLRTEASWALVRRLAATGTACLAIGLLADWSGICPSVKRIWTPSWVLVSGGWCFLFLAGFSAVCDVKGWNGWSFPLRVIGANSIVAYCADHLINGFILASFKTHFGQDVFKFEGTRYEAFEPILSGAAVLAVLWMILWWMYRQRIFVRI
jgi:predicted acyltransferase